MTTLILVVCLMGSPDICRDEAPPQDPGLSCLMQGEIAAQAWLLEHPKWTLKGWKCRLGPTPKES